MARKLDRIVVIDVESTCWPGAPPPGQESEIIEIGLCVIDVAAAQRLEKRSILVRPERSAVSEFCTQLTTLTQSQVEQGISFEQACTLLRDEYALKLRTWASYGDYDRRQFERQCQAREIASPFGKTHINVKNLFAICQALSHEVGLDGALGILGLPLEGTHHRGDDDAWNIANVLLTLLRRVRS
jgi:inhibitor of KinA sporulation pathway (predicted exonuclease)